jgi:hypothetical protein
MPIVRPTRFAHRTNARLSFRSSGPRWRAAEQALERMPPKGAPVSRALGLMKSPQKEVESKPEEQP